MAIFNSYVKLPEGRLLKKQFPDASWTSSFQRIQRTMENHENTSPSSPSSTKVQQHIHPKPRPGQGQANQFESITHLFTQTFGFQTQLFTHLVLCIQLLNRISGPATTRFHPGPGDTAGISDRQRGRSHNQVRSPENLQACPILPHITTIYH